MCMDVDELVSNSQDKLKTWQDNTDKQVSQCLILEVLIYTAVW